MISAAEARRLCPNIVLQHVATFREGEGGVWAYRDDAFKSITTDKVSLDPYRGESRKILNVVKEELVRWRAGLVSGSVSEVQVQEAILEKASVDEVFIDLSPLVFGVLLQRYPELRRGIDGDDRVTALPPPPTTALEWNAEDNLVDLDEKESEVDDPDWDDVAMLIGSEIVRSVRTAICERLSYTCSAGIARNKMMSKLGSACNKPNKQTIIRNRAVQNFLSGFKFTKIRMLGGKLGDQVTAHFGTDQVGDLLNVSLDQFRAKLDDDTAVWLYGIIRGDDRSEVNPRTQIKSMLSAKSFRPSVNTADQAEKWLRIFAADIYNRLVQDGVLENRRRPKTITLQHRQGGQYRSRQISIPAAKPIDELLLFELGKILLRQVIGDGRAWPCPHLSLSVGGFEDGVTNNKAIDGFLVRGEQARYLSQSRKEDDAWNNLSGEQQPLEKRRKLEDNGIKRFFTKEPGGFEKSLLDEPTAEHPKHNSPETELAFESHIAEIHPGFFMCTRCAKSFPEMEKIEHEDWHFAKDLETQEREAAVRSSQLPARSLSSPGKSHVRGRSSHSGKNGRGKPEKGQMRLNFG